MATNEYGQLKRHSWGVCVCVREREREREMRERLSFKVSPGYYKVHEVN